MKINFKSRMGDQNMFKSGFMLLVSTGLLTIFASGSAWAIEPIIADSKADVTVYRTESCGCCGKWVEHLEHNDISVKVFMVDNTDPVRSELGVPRQLASCHTAIAGDYWIEGHVPADLVTQLLNEKPDDIQGLAAAGMPPGSPGMDIPDKPAYKIHSVDDEGEIAVFAVRKGPVTR